MMKGAAWKSFIFLVLSVISILRQNDAFRVVNNDDKSARTYDKQQRILLLSLDGFRTDYVHKYKMKHFLNFINDGTKARYLKPQFTTQTLPNHWSLITGSIHAHIYGKF
jgi:predicted AlkP superfamily pyrophosphatase or phosphodiesterase